MGIFFIPIYFVSLVLATYLVLRLVCKKNGNIQNWVAAIFYGIVPTIIMLLIPILNISILLLGLTIIVTVGIVVTHNQKVLTQVIFTFLYSLFFLAIVASTTILTLRVGEVPLTRDPLEQCETYMTALSSAAQQYNSEYKEYPGSLQDLVNTEYINYSPLTVTQDSKANTSKKVNLHFIHLQKNAPSNYILAWFDPSAYMFDGQPSNLICILRQNWQYDKIETSTLDSEIKRSRQWVAKNISSNEEKNNQTSTTLQGLNFVDMFAHGYMIQRPLLTIGYFPGGKEIVFKQPGRKEEIHAVFTKGMPAPQKNDLSKTLTLHGQFEKIKTNRDGSNSPKSKVRKKVDIVGYKYFLVSSWECSK